MRYWFVVSAGLILTGFGAAASPADAPALVVDAGGHTGRVWKVLFTPDGRRLVSVSFDKSIRVWDVATGEPVRTVRPPAGPGEAGMVIAAAVTPDGKYLAAAGIGPDPDADHHPVYLIALETGKVERVLRGPTGIVNFVAVSPDGKYLAAGGHDKTARVWDLASGRLVRSLRGHGAMIEALAWGPDGRLLTTAHDKTARVWALPGGELLAEWAAHDEPVSAAAWSPDGKTLATGGRDGAVRLWDAAGKLVRDILGAAAGNVSAVAFTPDSARLAFTGWSNDKPTDRVAGVIGVADGTVALSRRSDLTLTDVAVSPDGKLFALATVQADILLADATTGVVARTLTARGPRPLGSVGWTADGAAVTWGTGHHPDPAVRSAADQERGFDLRALEYVAAPGAGAARTVLNQGDRQLVLGDDGLEARGGAGRPVAFRPTLQNGTAEEVHSFTWVGADRVAVGGQAAVHLFDAVTGKRLRRWVGHTDEVGGVAASPDGRFVASASSDRTVRVWAADRDEPLVSVLPAGADWVAWTPEGYYAASPGGERLIGWQVSGGPDAAATVHPADRFRASLYRPDVVAQVLKQGDVGKAVAAADMADGKWAAAARAVRAAAGKVKGGAGKLRDKVAGPLRVADVLPPAVVITAPDKPSTEVLDPAVEVRFVAKPLGPQPITAVRLLLDGRPYPGADGVRRFDPPRPGEVRDKWTVKLDPGKHALAVQAETAASTGVSDPVEVLVAATRAASPDAPDGSAPTAPTAPAPPALYVLAVGVSAYPGNLKLNYAAKDATALGQVCRDKSGTLFRKVEVKLLTDAEATRKNVLQGLTWLRKQMTQSDVAVVFFAGHGERDADGGFYLLPVDGDPADLLSTAVPGDQLKKALAGIPGRFVVMLDACHAGAVDGEKRRAGGGGADDLVRDLAADEAGVVVMCSAMGRESAIESVAVGHGYFTLALVEGLGGKAAKTADGAVYLHHLDAYVTDRVKELSGGRQHPVTVRPGSVRSFPLSKP